MGERKEGADWERHRGEERDCGGAGGKGGRRRRRAWRYGAAVEEVVHH